MTAATFTPRRYSHALSVVIPLRDLPLSTPSAPAVVVAQDLVRAAVLDAAWGEEVRTSAGLCHPGGMVAPGAYSAVQVDVEFDAATDEDAQGILGIALALEPRPVGGRVARWVVDSAPGETFRAHQEALAAVEVPKTLA